ncbi:methyl-accepting chemotaxis protein [Paenibacillus sp. 481]|uniref:methyl-accepting chemotaxis protein n=1 Tax=Paenibacillus sp. 481 TaxID=2835869 RepID=UPI001E5339C9|nr:methyl-accepting chemotaxis protein [Paenibacillus sp. 481]UHA74952.1 methyl-accepting chemotaxis protein [Paenibacillus sp. 481]
MKFGLQKKMVLGMFVVSLVTYGTSSLFIFVLKPYIAPNMNDTLYDMLVLFKGVFWTCLLSWLAARIIVKPLIQLTKAANDAAQGNLHVSLPTYKQNDEIKVLTESFGTMIGNLRHMIAEIQSSVDITTSNTVSLSQAMTHAATQIEQISRTAEHMNEGAERQANWTSETMSTVEHIHASAITVQERAEATERMTSNMLKTLAESEDILRSIIGGMLKAAVSGQQSIEQVQRLNDQAGQIGSISVTVREIADQTHLLALNASIEAARAGEQGAGFAVIASQVRKLAEQSALAVDDINERIVHMQAQVEQAVQLITSQVKSVSAEAEKEDAATGALATIADVTKQASQAVQFIAEAVSEQTEQFATTLERTRQMTEVAGEIAAGTRQVASATQEHTAVMEEMAASSEILRSQSDRLREQTQVFK